MKLYHCPKCHRRSPYIPLAMNICIPCQTEMEVEEYVE